MQRVMTRPPIRRPQEIFVEHDAPDGSAASGVLKAIGFLTASGCALLALYLTGSLPSSTPLEVTKTMTMFAVCVFIQGVIICALFVVLGTMCENLTAIRKNAQHLAGIRAELVNMNTKIDNTKIQE